MTIKPLTITTLSSQITQSQTTISVENTTRLSENTLPFYATITVAGETATLNNSEIVKITAIDNNNLTIERSQKDTTAKEFNTGSIIYRAIYDDDLFWIDKVYPIGSIYMSASNISPSDLFGGSWTQLKNCFLVGAGDIYASGESGGTTSHSHSINFDTSSHVLTSSESGIPSHNHSYSKSNTATNSHTLTASESGLVLHSHSLAMNRYNTGTAYLPQGGSPGSIMAGSSSQHPVDNNGVWTDRYGDYWGGLPFDDNIWGVQRTGGWTAISGHDHGITLISTNTGDAGGSSASSGHTHNVNGNTSSTSNLPPYLAIYMWKRTA